MVAVPVAAMTAGSACWRSQPLDEAFYDVICKHNGRAQASGQNKESYQIREEVGRLFDMRFDVTFFIASNSCDLVRDYQGIFAIKHRSSVHIRVLKKDIAWICYEHVFDKDMDDVKLAAISNPKST
ncbi:hypothetical protein SDJN03_00781, partial [Cucurbita argyrosperma subsp. sororia]